jgi:multidrug transporter EmrE-like cation transporter
MPLPLLLLAVLGQSIFVASSLISRWHFGSRPLGRAAFLSIWFLLIEILRWIGTVMQLKIISAVPIGTAIGILSGITMLMYPLLSWLMLREKPNRRSLAAIVLVICALLVLTWPIG